MSEKTEREARKAELRQEREAAFASTGGGGGGRGIPTNTGAPKLTAGADLISDTERLQLRTYTVNLDGVLQLEADRRLSSNALDRRIDNGGMRRWLEVGLPPKYHEQLHNQRKYRFERVLTTSVGESSTVANISSAGPEIYLPPGYENGRNYTTPVTKVYEEAVSLLPDDFTVVIHNQHFWVLDITKPERASRDFTGFNCIPNHMLREQSRSLLEERNLWESLSNATTLADLTLQERFDIVRAYTDAEAELTEHFFDYSNVAEVYDSQFLPAAAEAGEKPEDYADTFYRWFRAQGRFAFWSKFESTSRQRESNSRNQSIPEAIAASEALTDLVSVVFSPLTTSLTIEKVDKDTGEITYGILIHWGTELVRYATADELGDLRKTINAIQNSMMQHRTKAQMLLSLSHVKNIGDDWYPGSWDGVKQKDFVISLDDLSPEANTVLQQVLHGPYADFDPDFVIDPGPMVGEWHNRRVVRVLDSFNALIEMADYVAKGGKLTDQLLREKWYPRLINFENDLLIRGWWDANFDNGSEWSKGKLFAEYDLDNPNREFRAVSIYDWFYWQDPAWVMGLGNDQYVFHHIVEYVNERFREAGLGEIQIRIDGPDPDYFRHYDFAKRIWEQQPADPLEERFRRELRQTEDIGGWKLRPTIDKQFAGLPILHTDSRADLVEILRELLNLADQKSLDFAALLNHGKDGTSRGLDFGHVTREVAGGYGWGYGTPEEVMTRIHQFYEMPLKAKYFTSMRGIIESMFFDPWLMSSREKKMSALTGAIRNRDLNFDYAHKLAQILQQMAGPFAEPLPHPNRNTPWVPKVEELFVSGETVTLLGAHRIKRIEDSSLVSERWVQVD